MGPRRPGGRPRPATAPARRDGSRRRRPRVAGRGDAHPTRDGRHARRRHWWPVRWPGEADRPRPAARRRARPARPRRTDQPPRPRRDRVPRTMARRLPGWARDGHPRPARARPGHEQGARDRPRHRLPARPVRVARGLRIRGLSRRTGRARGPGRGRGADSPKPGQERACLAASWRAGTHHQAEGPDRERDGVGRGPPGCAGPGRRPHARDGQSAARLEGRGAARRVVRVAGRIAGARPGVGATGARRSNRHRRRQRRRQVHPARPDRSAASPDRRQCRRGRDRADRLLRPTRPRARSHPAGARRSGGRQGPALLGRPRADAAVLVRRRCAVRADGHPQWG